MSDIGDDMRLHRRLYSQRNGCRALGRGRWEEGVARWKEGVALRIGPMDTMHVCACPHMRLGPRQVNSGAPSIVRP